MEYCLLCGQPTTTHDDGKCGNVRESEGNRVREKAVKIVADPAAEHAVVYDGERLVIRPDAEPHDVGWLILSMLTGNSDSNGGVPDA